MTTKELSEFTGKNRTTVERWCAKCTLNSVRDKVQNAHKGNPADFTVDEVEQILLSGSLSKDAVSILMKNARNENNNTGDIIKDVMREMLPVFSEMIQQNNKALLTMIENKSEAKQIGSTYIKPNHYSLKAYMLLKKIPVPHKGQMILLGKELRKLSQQNNKEMVKVPDEQYGEVNGYDLEVLDLFFRQD